MKSLAIRKLSNPVTGILCGLIIGVSIMVTPAVAQRVRVPPVELVRGGFGLVAPVMANNNSEDEIVDGATLKTDPELESILEKAERYRADGNYLVATTLWQAVLQRSGDALYSSDNQTYYSLVQQVERIIANLPPDGLEKYRNTADANAKEIMAQADGEYDQQALNRVVREYFISSLGDDAAFQLGCIYLDQFDFIGARRMFEKIIRQYPDSSVPREQVLARIALCQSFMGDLDSAKLTLQEAAKTGRDSNLVNEVRDTLGKISTTQNTSNVSGKWLMRMGDSRRYGLMPSLPFEFTGRDLIARWQYYVEPRDHYNNSADASGKYVIAQKYDAERIKGTRTEFEKQLIEKWEKLNWRPSGHVLINDNKIYYKTAADLVVFDLDKISLAPTKPDESATTLWRSLWRNSFIEDDATRMMAAIRKQWNSYARRQQVHFDEDRPTTTAEVQLFGDTIHQQMSISNGVVYSIEGTRFDRENKTTKKAVSAQWNASFRRTRSNHLTAYNADTGMVLWSLPKNVEQKEDEKIIDDEVESPWLEGGGFMSAPVGYGNVILAAVNQGGAVYVYALDPKNEGKTIWKSFLCDEPDSSASPWSPINLSIDGSDLFVTCGLGVVFVLDPATGLVRFAKRYERVGKLDNAFRRLGWNSTRKSYNGWSEDVIIPYGREMICFSSDTQEIIAYDRNNGEMIWKNSMDPRGYRIDYLLGIYDNKMYAAGRETVVAFDLEGEGLMVWGGEQVFGGKLSKGRGMLTPGGIYVPVENAIYKIDLNGDGSNANVVAKAGVKMGTNAPVGNLFSDGQRIWVHGGTRLYALWPGDKKQDDDDQKPDDKDSKQKSKSPAKKTNDETNNKK